MNEFGPISRALGRSKLGAVLIVLQVALTVAILANALPVVLERIEKVTRSSGVAEKELFVILASDPDLKRDLVGRLAAERQRLLAVDGVADASYTGSFPNGGGGWSTGVDADLKAGSTPNSVLYFSDTHALNTLGVTLKAGRWFDAREIQLFGDSTEMNPKTIVITEALAEKLFPGASAIGKRVSVMAEPKTLDSEVIGVVSNVARPWANWGDYYISSFVPYTSAGTAYWIVRAKPGQDVEAVMTRALDALAKSDRSVIYGTDKRTLTEARKDTYASDMVLCFLLTTFTALLIAVTVLGIVGLASVWVVQRSRLIGVRRAMGAKRGESTSDCRQANLLLSGTGALLGVGLAYGLNYLLSITMDAKPLPWWPVFVGALLLVIVGQLAVTQPARRAARIAPAIATRSA